MKKLVKMSLVAAVAVAGLTNVNAASLEESIKGVDISGMVRYRYTDTNVKNASGSAQENDYDIELTAKIPVTDNIKAIIKLDVDGDLRADSSSSTQPSDAKPSVNVEDVYFSYTNNGYVVNAGKQNVAGPFTDALNGTGIVAMAPVGPVTLAAAWFNATAAAYSDIAAIGVIGSFGPVNASAWYADMADMADVYSLALDGTVGPVSLDARYTSKDVDNATSANDDLSVFKINAAADLGMFALTAGFAVTGDENASNGGAALDGESDASANDFQLEQIDVAQLSDAKGYKLGASISPIEKLTLGLDYLGATEKISGAKTKYKETVASVSYAVSSNFKVSSYFSMAKKKTMTTTKSNQGRLELKYSF